MNQTQRLIDSIRDAPHDTIIVAGMFAIPVLIALWIVNRMRHPERGLLHALVIASVGFVLVPCVSSAVLILWVRTGGDSIQPHTLPGGFFQDRQINRVTSNLVYYLNANKMEGIRDGLFGVRIVARPTSGFSY